MCRCELIANSLKLDVEGAGLSVLYGAIDGERLNRTDGIAERNGRGDSGSFGARRALRSGGRSRLPRMWQNDARCCR